MANTEGMPDHVMEALLTPDDNPTRTTTDRSARPRSSFLRQRMEMSMGERPAATVIRRSNPRNVNSSKTEEKKEVADSTIERDAPPPILGSIVERPVEITTQVARSRGAHEVRSRFAAQRLDEKNDRVPATIGFPSVNVPVGTFVKKSSSSRRGRREQQPTPSKRTPILKAQAPITDSASLEDSSQNEAQAMLDQMSPQEIDESVQELKAALSPDTLAFLKARGRKKSQQHIDSQKTHVSTAVPSNRGSDETKEKERVAKLLSSVRNYNDMDALLAAETDEAVYLPNDQAANGTDDFETACELLRSSNPRQTLWAARVVCQRLEQDVQNGESYYPGNTTTWPYPTILPVSLRCLLDTPVTFSNRFVLHSLIIRAVYALLQLGAHPDHVVDVTGERETGASIYQECFLSDTVPTPPFGSCYPPIEAEQVVSTDDGEALAYTTSSSATSAQKDGEAFIKDPMWTLLSRMKILPRMAELLARRSTTSQEAIPSEATTSICGILAMLCMRSPGAASAIVQNKTLIPSLLQRTYLLSYEAEESSLSCLFDPKFVLPPLLLMCTLARQSRLAASSLPVEEVLPPLLAFKAETRREHEVQQWALVVWRTLLRYGLALTSLQTFVPLSVLHIELSDPGEFNLAAEYNTSLAAVLQCAKIGTSKKGNIDRNIFSNETEEALSTTRSFLEKHVDQTIRQCNNNIGGIAILSQRAEESRIRLWASRIRLLHAYAALLEQECTVTNEQWDHLALATKNLTESDSFLYALSVVPPCRYISNDLADCATGAVPGISTRTEATACAFLEALASLVSIVVRNVENSSNTKIEWLTCSFCRPVSEWQRGAVSEISPSDNASRARQGWLNKTYASINSALITAFTAFEEIGLEFAEVRSMVLTLVGRLQPGEEASAAVLFSSDFLFRPKSSTEEQSTVSSFFMRELCSSDHARAQLDHSFKLQSGFGITRDGWGAFEIGSLLPEVDRNAPGRNPLGGLLPLGKLWLWKALASRTDGKDEIRTLLELILEVEDENGFSSQIPSGAKLYFVMNVCLQPERVLQDGCVSEIVMKLFDRYLESSTDMNDFVRGLTRACFDHSKTGTDMESATRPSELDPSDQKLLKVLVGGNVLSKRESQALNDFVGDLCTVFTEYGAQYDAFTKCIRLFIGSSFPENTRLSALQNLADVLHLLTLPVEREELAGPELRTALEQSLTFGGTDDDGGLLSKRRDPPSVLDTIEAMLKRDLLLKEGLFYLFAIASLARSVCVGSRIDPANPGSSARRLDGLDSRTRELVREIVRKFQMLEKNTTKALAQVTIEVFCDPSIQ